MFAVPKAARASASLWCLIKSLFPVVFLPALPLTGQVEARIVASCSFENNTTPFCGWTTGPWSDGHWERSTASLNLATGPPRAHATVGGTHFIRLNSANFKTPQGIVEPGKSVSLLTPDLAGVTCVVLLYMKHGDDSIGDLRVGIAANGTTRVKEVWTKERNTDNTWHCQVLSLSTPTAENQAIYIEAESGQNELGDIGVDEVFLLNNTCPSQSDCFSFLKGPSESTTQNISLTASSTVPLTSLVSSSVSPSSSGRDSTTTAVQLTTTEASLHPEPEVDVVIIIATVIPVVVLLIAGIVAYLCYQRRLSQHRARRQSVDTARARDEPSPEEHYDVIDPPDKAPDPQDFTEDSGLGSSDPYDELDDSSGGTRRQQE